MKFGPVPVADAPGAILAHSVRLPDRRLRKGVLLQTEDVAALRAAGLDTVVVARLDPDDIDENQAAAHLAAAIVPDAEAAALRISAPFTGRVNLLAEGPGVAMVDAPALHRFNQIDPMITIATVPPFQQMAPGGMVATIKIIAYGVARADVLQAADTARNALRLARPVFGSAGLVITDIPGGPDNAKGIRSMRNRVQALGLDLAEVLTVPHHPEALAEAVRAVQGEIVMILTGSATSDPEDVAPSAVRLAGGQVDRFGMPVDPGNLLFLGTLPDRPVIGLPGCARAPALNGADWVLARVACGIPVSAEDIAGMGVGGLLKEIPSRPQPRRGSG